MVPLYLVAEKEGFEPSNPFTGYTISSRAPSTKLGDFSIFGCAFRLASGDAGQAPSNEQSNHTTAARLRQVAQANLFPLSQTARGM